MAYHPLVCRFMLFLQGDSSNSEYKQRFQYKVYVIETYKWGGGTVQEQPRGNGTGNQDSRVRPRH